jgi:DNA-binding CsgD family transcriptional regulator
MGRPTSSGLPPNPPTNPDLYGLVRGLIRHSGDGAPGPEDVGKVVFDVWVDGYRCVLIHQPGPAAGRVELSPREYEIARMVAKGFPNKMIARVLDISTWTVGTYLRRIFAKLGVSSRAAMVAVVLEAEGLSPPNGLDAKSRHVRGAPAGGHPAGRPAEFVPAGGHRGP